MACGAIIVHIIANSPNSCTAYSYNLGKMPVDVNSSGLHNYGFQSSDKEACSNACASP